MSLKDTLAKLQQQEQDKARWEKDKPQLIKEWQESVSSLIEDICRYLNDYKADGTMSFSKREIELSEETLGRYRIAALSIVAGPVTIMVDPIGRMIVGATGRVDIYRQGHGSEQNRVVLLRVQTSATDATPKWATRSPPGVGAPVVRAVPQRSSLVPLDKEILEQYLEFLLR